MSVELNIVPPEKRITIPRSLLDAGINALLSLAIYTACVVTTMKVVTAISSLQGLK